ncbi:MAG: diguanylate cyclase [SAR324 cluster bacterium]|nr:diguanylate cyclase [SAR324 cluster bacterium]
MQRFPLFTDQAHPNLDEFVEILKEGRYFKSINSTLLKNILKLGNLLLLKKDEHLIHQGDDSPPELYILLEGSLAVSSHGNFILRLESPGDIAGEMAILTPGPRSAEVVAETETKIIGFSQRVFAVDEQSDTVPVFYLMFSYILAEKLRITTAQSLVRKNSRVISPEKTRIAVIDENYNDRLIIGGVIRTEWSEAIVSEFDDMTVFLDDAMNHNFDLYIVDLEFKHHFKTQEEAIKSAFKTLKIHGIPIFAISRLCSDVAEREKLMKLGVNEMLAKPFAVFDLKHSIIKSRVGYYQQRELDLIEQDADTDRLTGLANRRRLDQFLEALFTIYPENQKPFSLVIADVDNFKFYNDTHGHQMGDVVLAGVASVFASSVRKGDLAARFGGEEFVMILPNCDKANATLVAEKLRQAMEDEEFPMQEQQPLGNLTVTLGVATFPDDASDIEELLKKADDCLYIGKESGRNTVIAAKS